MAFEFDTPEKGDTSGDLVAAGTYCAEIVAWDDDLERHDAIIAEFRILSGTTPGQEGLVYEEWFRTGSKHPDLDTAEGKTKALLRRLKKTAVAAGYREPAPGELFRIEPKFMVGKRVIIVLDENTYKNVTKGKLAWDGVHRIDAEEFEIPMPQDVDPLSL